MKSLSLYFLIALFFIAPVRPGFAEPMGLENFKEDFESFPLARFQDEVTDALAIKHSGRTEGRFDTWLFWMRWRPALYDAAGKARYATREEWIRTYSAMSVRQRSVVESRLAGPLPVPHAQLLLRWLRDPEKSLDTVDKYLVLRKLGLPAPVAFADPVQAARQLTTWYATDPTKQNRNAWAQDFALLRQYLTLWAADRNHPERPALAQSTLFGFPKPFVPISELARQIADARTAAKADREELHALLDGLAFEGVPAFDVAAWFEFEKILAFRASDALGEWTQIKALGAMKYQWAWPASTWKPLTELLHRKLRNRQYVEAIFNAVGGRGEITDEFWNELAAYGRAQSPQNLESAIAMLNLQPRWPEPVWNVVFEWLAKGQDPAAPQYAAWIKSEKFLKWVLKPEWNDSVWSRMIPFASAKENLFFGDDFSGQYFLKLRTASELTASLDAVARFVADDIARGEWQLRSDPWPLFIDERWSDGVFRIVGRILESDNVAAKRRVLRAMAVQGGWPPAVESQIAKLILDPNEMLSRAALESLSGKRKLGDAIWSSIRQRLQNRSDEKWALSVLLQYRGAWGKPAWECVEIVAGRPDASADLLSIVVLILEVRSDWTPNIWAAVPTMFRKVTESRTAYLLTILVSKQEVWPENFRSQTSALLEDASPITRQEIREALGKRALTPEENQTFARLLLDRTELSQEISRSLFGRKNWDNDTWTAFSKLYRSASEDRKDELRNTVRNGPEEMHPDFWDVVADELDDARDDVKVVQRWQDLIAERRDWPPRIEAILVERLDHPDTDMRLAALKAMSGPRPKLSRALWAALSRRFAEDDENFFIYATFALPYGPWPEAVIPTLLRQANTPAKAMYVELAIQRIPEWTGREWAAEMGLWRDKHLSLEEWISYLGEDRIWPDDVWWEFLTLENDEKFGSAFATIIERGMKQKVWPDFFGLGSRRSFRIRTNCFFYASCTPD